jgi:hypothetical protein
MVSKPPHVSDKDGRGLAVAALVLAFLFAPLGIYAGYRVRAKFPYPSATAITRVAIWVGYTIIAVVLVGVALPYAFVAVF